MGNLNMFLTLGFYMLPMFFMIAEAWSNAIFETLFEHLLAEDYNKHLNSFFDTSAHKEVDGSTKINNKKRELEEMRRRNCCWYYLCSCFKHDDSR